MDINNLIESIDIAYTEVDNFVFKSKYYNGDEEIILKVKKILSLLKEELLNHPESINERVLRGMQDLGMASFKYFENTNLEKALNSLTSITKTVCCYELK